MSLNRWVGSIFVATFAFATAPFPQKCPAAERLAPMLRLPATGEDPTAIDFDNLCILQGEHGVVTQGAEPWRFRLHSYLAFHDGRYCCMWSHGPVVEDNPTQHVRYATSDDGLHWSGPRPIVGPSPRAGFRYISRGFWQREGKLLALVSHDEAFNEHGRVHFFGASLELLAFEWRPADQTWRELGVVYRDAINNFPPQRLPDGDWAMMRRDHWRDVSLLVGGVNSPLEWLSVPVAAAQSADGFRPEEPDWWTLPDGRLLGLFRDNGRSKRFYRSTSPDDGRTWSIPERTNFPDATSKFFCLRTSLGRYVLVSNANPAGRNPLCLAVSDDGVTFTRLARLPIPATAPGGDSAQAPGGKRDTWQYPHVIEHDGKLLVAFSRNKTAIEVVKLPLGEIDRLSRAE
jgi:hypothetical protein